MILIGFGSGGVASAFSYTSAAFLTLILGYLVCRYKIKEVFADYEKKDYSSLNKEFFNYSWPIVFYSIISTIFFSIDIFSLGYYKSASAVGIYNAAAPIAGLMGLIPTLFMQLFFPMINRAYSNKNYNLIEQTSKQITKWIFMITLPAFILLFFFPGAALNILFGADYLPAENALRLLLLSSFISAIFIVSSNLMLMLGKSRLILFNMMISAILNLTLNSLLIPMDSIFYLDNSNGLIGASLATLLSVLFFNLLFIFQTKKYLLFIPFRRKMINLLLISVIPSAALFYARRIMPKNIFSIIILSLSFILIYWFFALIFHSLDKNDIMIINSFWQRIKSFKGK
jgi:O-antigen/teichoic acid export membrane protein